MENNYLNYQQSYDAIEYLFEAKDGPPDFGKKHDKLLFRAQLFYFMGEIEAAFGVWLIPLFVGIIASLGWSIMSGNSSYRALVDHQAAEIPVDWRIAVYFAPSNAGEDIKSWLAPQRLNWTRFVPQCDGDLGRRLVTAALRNSITAASGFI